MCKAGIQAPRQLHGSMSESDTNSSVDIISTPSWSATDTSDDEVVWGVSDEFSSESSLSDYVLLPRTRHAAATHDSDSSDSASETGLSLPFDLLSITASSNVDDEPHANESPQVHQGPTPANNSQGSPPRTPQFDGGAATPTSLYEDASSFITQYVYDLS